MDRLDKALARLASKQRERVKDILDKLSRGNIRNLDVKKLKGRDVFRVRKGDIRVLYRLDKGKIFLLAIERRSDTTYK